MRRAAQPWSASVQAVLAHLRAAGVSGIPEPLGFDDLGRESVGYVPGNVWNDPLPELVWRESTLLAVTRLLPRRDRRLRAARGRALDAADAG